MVLQWRRRERPVAGRRTRLAGPRRRVRPIDGLIALVATGAALLALGPLGRPESPSVVRWTTVVALAGGFVAAERFLVHIPARPTAHTLTFAELPLVLGLFSVPPLWLVGAHVAGAGLALAFEGAMSGVRRTFNVVQYALSTGLVLVVFHALGGRPSGPSLRAVDWASAFVAVVLSSAVSIGLIATAMTAVGERPSRRRFGYMLGAGLGVTTTNTSLALLAVLVARDDPRALLLLIVPLGVVFASYRAYVAQYRRTRQVEFLNRATRDLVAARSVEDGLARLLDHLLATFHCRRAEVVLFSGGPGGDVLRLSQRDAERGEVVAVTGGAADRLAASAGADHQPLEAYLVERGFAPGALTARLVDDDGILGLLVVGDPVDAAARPEPDDAKLLDTVAHQAATLLRYDRLEQAFASLRIEQDRFRHQALHDPVTGLGNRRLLDERLGEALAASRPLTVVLVDLDDFKAVNDSLGHAAGDELLVAVGQRIRGSLRAPDLVVRLGGDEFALLLVDPESQAEAEPVADRVLAALTQPFGLAGSSVSVGASIGLAGTVGVESLPAAELLARADAAMYEAKRAGKSQVRSWQQPRLPAA